MASIQSHIRALQSYIDRRGARLLRTTLPPAVHGRVCRNLISLRKDLAPKQELAALIHELAHWLVHRDQRSLMDCTVFEYEAEAVEALVMMRLGLSYTGADTGATGFSRPTENLLSASVARVLLASASLCQALGVARMPGSEAQASVDLEATAGKEIVFEYEQYGMGDFLGLPEAL